MPFRPRNFLRPQPFRVVPSFLYNDGDPDLGGSTGENHFRSTVDALDKQLTMAIRLKPGSGSINHNRRQHAFGWAETVTDYDSLMFGLSDNNSAENLDGHILIANRTSGGNGNIASIDVLSWDGASPWLHLVSRRHADGSMELWCKVGGQYLYNRQATTTSGGSGLTTLNQSGAAFSTTEQYNEIDAAMCDGAVWMDTHLSLEEIFQYLDGEDPINIRRWALSYAPQRQGGDLVDRVDGTVWTESSTAPIIGPNLVLANPTILPMPWRAPAAPPAGASSSLPLLGVG